MAFSGSPILPLCLQSPLTHPPLLKRDVIFGHPGAHIILKWAKSMQSSSKHQVIQIPLLPQSPLCPVTVLKHLLQSIPAAPPAPLFLLPPTHCPHDQYLLVKDYHGLGFESFSLWVPFIQEVGGFLGC